MNRHAAAGLGLLMLAAAPVASAPGGRHILPAEVTFPEGIAYDAKSGTIYTVASPDGVIARVNARTGAVAVVQAPAVKAQIGAAFPGVLGLNIDSRGRLWMAGGRTGKVYVTNPKTGALIQTIEPPEAAKGLINDITFAGGKAYFTDTLRPMLWAAGTGANVPAKPELWLDFNGTPLEYATGANLNGITSTKDGKTLLTGQMNKGLLFKIDVATKKITPIDIKGETVEGVDGLVLRGRTLYVIRQPAAEIVTIELSRDMSSGTVVKRTNALGLLSPATAVVVGDELVVVNAQFNKFRSNDPEKPFSLQRVPLSQLTR